MTTQNHLAFKLASEALEGPVALGFEPALARFVLRIAPADLASAAAASGTALPTAIGEATRQGTRRALCLGPDEWVLWAEESEQDAVEAAFEALRPAVPHSLVATGDREIALSLEGPQAVTLLSVGCPIDLDALVPGSGTRTVFDGVQVVLFRDGPDRFVLEAWRSFVPHVWALLNVANRELAIGL